MKDLRDNLVDHPHKNDLLNYSSNQAWSKLSKEKIEVIEEHLFDCEKCRQLVEISVLLDGTDGANSLFGEEQIQAPSWWTKEASQNIFNRIQNQAYEEGLWKETVENKAVINFPNRETPRVRIHSLLEKFKSTLRLWTTRMNYESIGVLAFGIVVTAVCIGVYCIKISQQNSGGEPTQSAKAETSPTSKSVPPAVGTATSDPKNLSEHLVGKNIDHAKDNSNISTEIASFDASDIGVLGIKEASLEQRGVGAGATGGITVRTLGNKANKAGGVEFEFIGNDDVLNQRFTVDIFLYPDDAIPVNTIRGQKLSSLKRWGYNFIPGDYNLRFNFNKDGGSDSKLAPMMRLYVFNKKILSLKTTTTFQADNGSNLLDQSEPQLEILANDELGSGNGY